MKVYTFSYVVCHYYHSMVFAYALKYGICICSKDSCAISIVFLYALVCYVINTVFTTYLNVLCNVD